MKAGINLKLANGTSIGAHLGLDGDVMILIEEPSHTVLINMTKQKAAALKDDLASLDLVTEQG